MLGYVTLTSALQYIQPRMCYLLFTKEHFSGYYICQCGTTKSKVQLNLANIE